MAALKPPMIAKLKCYEAWTAAWRQAQNADGIVSGVVPHDALYDCCRFGHAGGLFPVSPGRES